MHDILNPATVLTTHEWEKQGYAWYFSISESYPKPHGEFEPLSSFALSIFYLLFMKILWATIKKMIFFLIQFGTKYTSRVS